MSKMNMEDGRKRPSSEDSPRHRSALGRALILGTNLAVGMGLFVLSGYYLDRRHGGEGHLWTVAGMVLGFTYGGYELWRTIRELNETDDSRKGPPGSVA